MLPGSRWLVLALGLLAWTTFVIRSYQVFGPDSVYVQPFNSDSALPVLMANDDKIDLFRTYNYGQDQIGSWPFMTGQIVHRKTGYVWTPRSVFLAQVIWLACSVLLVAILCRGYGPLVGLFVAVLFALHPVVRHYFFVLNQRNAWQCTTLILAWFSLRQVSDRVAKDGSRSLLMILLLSLFSFLAIWLSTLSGPLLLAIAAIELFRLRMLAESNSMRRSLRQCVAILFLPILGAIAAEALLKAAYHRHALKHFGTDFKTPTEFDWGNLLANLGQLWQVFTSQPWWPLALWGMLASLVALGYLLIAAFARQLNRDSNGRVVADLLAMIAGCGVMAWGSSIIAVLFTWVRLNSYGPRYLAQTHMFGSLAGLCTIVLLGRLFVGRQAEGTLIIGPIFVVVMLLLPGAVMSGFLRPPSVGPTLLDEVIRSSLRVTVF